MRNTQTLNALQEICDYIGNTKEKNMVEIGCYQGESTQIWCENFNHVYAIDPWILGKGYDSKDVASIMMSNNVEFGFDKRLKQFSNFTKVKDFSYNVSNQFKDKSLDFVYIDGEHTYEGVKRDIELYLSKIKKGGYIGGHDYKPKWQGVMDAVNEIFIKPEKEFLDRSWIIKI